MNTYVLDTGFFIISRDYYPETFPSFWKKLNEAVSQEIISSVEQVRAELEQYKGEQEHLANWISNNRNIFTNPTPEEQNVVRGIFQNREFQTLISKKQTMKGNPVADPFVIAKAIANQSIVVTREKPAPTRKAGNKKKRKEEIQGAYKIPDICKHYNVECVLPQKFMEQQRWNF